jgi:hypothetical protein
LKRRRVKASAVLCIRHERSGGDGEHYRQLVPGLGWLLGGAAVAVAGP